MHNYYKEPFLLQFNLHLIINFTNFFMQPNLSFARKYEIANIYFY